MPTRLRSLGKSVCGWPTDVPSITISPFSERLQPVYTFNQRGFAAARRAAHHHHIAFGDAGAAIGKHLKIAIPFIHIVDFNHFYTRNLFCKRFTPKVAIALTAKYTAPANRIYGVSMPIKSPRT